MPHSLTKAQLRAFHARMAHPKTAFDEVAKSAYQNELKRHSPARAAYIAESVAGSIAVRKGIYGGSKKYRHSGTIKLRRK
jgi:hypothetical protein